MKELHKQRRQCLCTAGEAETSLGMLGISRMRLGESVKIVIKCWSDDARWDLPTVRQAWSQTYFGETSEVFYCYTSALHAISPVSSCTSKHILRACFA